MTIHAHIRNLLLDELSSVKADEGAQLNDTLRLLAKWRSTLIQNTLLQRHGTKVLDGPFRGFDFIPESAEGCHIPKLLGCYEQPLQPYIETVVQANYSLVLNIGCAEGYYAVGIARRMVSTRVLAFDSNPNAQRVAAELAAKNNVTERVTIGGLFKPEDFVAYAGQKILVICDIEGGERELLDAQLAPTLATMDLIVESHECLIPGVTNLLVGRFAPTHNITVVHDNGHRQLPNVPGWFHNLAHLDQLLAVWEWRSGPTPWLVMVAKEVGGQ